jgi:threonine/homoserine/homoserine lactone efflux protein
MDVSALLAVIIGTAVNSAMPGPCMILIAARTAQSGSAAGLRTSLGIAAAQLLYAVVALVLLSLALTISDSVESIIRFAGAGILVALALQMLTQKIPSHARQEASHARPASDILLGLGVGLSSPFNLVFMFSILPQFVSRDALVDPTIAILLPAILMATMGPMIGTIWVASGARLLGQWFTPVLVRGGAFVLLALACMSIFPRA